MATMCTKYNHTQERRGSWAQEVDMPVRQSKNSNEQHSIVLGGATDSCRFDSSYKKAYQSDGGHNPEERDALRKNQRMRITDMQQKHFIFGHSPPTLQSELHGSLQPPSLEALTSRLVMPIGGKNNKGASNVFVSDQDRDQWRDGMTTTARHSFKSDPEKANEGKWDTRAHMRAMRSAHFDIGVAKDEWRSSAQDAFGGDRPQGGGVAAKPATHSSVPLGRVGAGAGGGEPQPDFEAARVQTALRPRGGLLLEKGADAARVLGPAIVAADKGDAVAAFLAAQWEAKPGTVLDEVLANLDGPLENKVLIVAKAAQTLQAKVARHSGYKRHNLMELFVMTLYTMAGPDIDRLMGYPDAPDSDDKEAWAAYKPRNSAMFSAVNSAMRAAASAETLNTSAWPGCDVQRWAKTIVLLIALANRDESAATSRGLAGLPQTVMDTHLALRPGETLVWPSPSSTALDPHVARAYILGEANNATKTAGGVLLFELKVRCGLHLQEVSKYPKEAELLLPPLCELAVERLTQGEKWTTVSVTAQPRQGDEAWRRMLRASQAEGERVAWPLEEAEAAHQASLRQAAPRPNDTVAKRVAACMLPSQHGCPTSKYLNALPQSRVSDAGAARLSEFVVKHATTKEGSVLTEVLDNLSSPLPPAECVVAIAKAALYLKAKVRSNAQYNRYNLMELFVMTLYTMAGPDIDRLMGYPDAPDSDDKEAWAAYKPRNSAMFSAVNSAMRAGGQAEPGALNTEAWPGCDVQRWAKTIVLLIALASRDESVATSRGLAGLPQTVMDTHLALRPGETLVWPAPSSTALDPHVARAYILGEANNATKTAGGVLLFELKVRCGLHLQEVSKYPKEAELLLPPLCELAVERLTQGEKWTTVSVTAQPRQGDAMLSSAGEDILYEAARAAAQLQQGEEEYQKTLKGGYGRRADGAPGYATSQQTYGARVGEFKPEMGKAKELSKDLRRSNMVLGYDERRFDTEMTDMFRRPKYARRHLHDPHTPATPTPSV